ncbi:hypothetical protein VHEMI10163 [[Torrubiella] hemipterigena]|uniref:Uncharacterized protein n=1 Tax=[Torrubiella] hemipterigena TaxID=1531966 RepID=A0A0A1TI38_9HYPO|nr:hypothetical protein VHEMI10163 [[Torrubiella] hemipterigena]
MLANCFALAVLAATAAAQGIVKGTNPKVFYKFNVASRTAQCPKLLPEHVDDGMKRFDGLFPPRYTYENTTKDEDQIFVGALYLSYPEGTFAFALDYNFALPNTTDNWVEKGADIANVYTAIREDIVRTWAADTFQFKTYNVSKSTNGRPPKHAGALTVQIQTPTFVKGCDTSCGGDCNPNKCQC